MNDLLHVIAGAATGAVCTILINRALARRTNGSGRSSLRAARELADLTSTAEDLLRRVSDLESSLQAVIRRGNRHGD